MQDYTLKFRVVQIESVKHWEAILISEFGRQYNGYALTPEEAAQKCIENASWSTDDDWTKNPDEVEGY